MQGVILSTAYGQRSKKRSKEQRKGQKIKQRNQLHITRPTGGVSKTVKNRRSHRLAIHITKKASEADVLVRLNGFGRLLRLFTPAPALQCDWLK